MTLRAYITVILCTATTLGRAQNLVYNGDFEIYSQCVGTVTGNVAGWSGSATPDFCNVCNGSVPGSPCGFQQDIFGGNSYIGQYFLSLWQVQQYPQYVNDREYLHTQLLDTLQAGHRYLASFYISRGDYNAYAIAPAGMLFTDSATNQPGLHVFIPATPQVVYKSLLSDTANWILVQDTFRAAGNELYLTIGNFNTTANSDTVFLQATYNGGFNAWPAAYCLVDGVSVYDVTNGACNSYWNAGADKYIFAGDSIRLGAIDTDGSTYLWQNSIGGNTFLSSNTDARPWASPTVTTTYYVIKNCGAGNIFMDTVTVNVQYPANVAELNKEDLSTNVYPNPNNGIIILEYALRSDAFLEITDISGNLIDKYTLAASGHQLEVKNDKLENGVYLYRVICEDKQLKGGKVVILK